MIRAKTTQEFINESKLLHGDMTFGYDKAIYKSAKVKLDLKCIKCDKYFKTRPTDHTSKRYGCPGCCKSKSEKMAISIVRTILDCKFESASPLEVPWLKGLYLDGYNEEIKLALEYQGIQHSEFPNFFHKTEIEFEKQKKRDRKKYARCTKNDIKLILVPHTLTHKNYKKMYDWIYDQILIFGFLKK